MKRLLLPIISLCLFGQVQGQNINYDARISQFRADCNSDPFGSNEYTWFGFISDNLGGETSSGCVTKDGSPPEVQVGNYANRMRNNLPITFIQGRLDAWEDDSGSRCAFNNDDCRNQETGNEDLNNALEYTSTVSSFEVNGMDFGMTVDYNYRYTTVDFEEALDVVNLTGAFFSGGNRPFWGASGNWAFFGNDCAASGTIENNETSSFSYFSSCHSQVQFRWRVSSQANADWLEFYVDGALIDRISGEVGWTNYTYDLPADNDRDTLEWRYVKDGGISVGLDRGFVDLLSFSSGSNFQAGQIAGDQTICFAGNPDPLTSVSPAESFGNFVNYTWQRSFDQVNWFNVGNGLEYDPGSTFQTTYYRRSASDNCGGSGVSNVIEITVSEQATAPTGVMGPASAVCPNVLTTLTASGGNSGSNGEIQWYSGPNGTGSLIGTGSSIMVNAEITTTYYLRRESDCNTTGDFIYALEVRPFVYAGVGTVMSDGFCTDDAGWNHFFTSTGEIILSLQGDLSGATSAPVASIVNAGDFYQESLGGPGNCDAPGYPGEERFELGRSWNIDFVGTLNPPYTIRLYQPNAEINTMTTAAAAHITDNPSCGYTYKYPTSDGLVYFKNDLGGYVAPQYDLPTQLPNTNGIVTGVEYVELSNISSFSGGSGGVVLLPDPALPVELSFFNAKRLRQGINEISWQTLTEANNDYFEVERSINNGQHFTPIARINGARYSQVPLHYSFLDVQLPQVVTLYYRLKQVDADGTIAYSSVQSVSQSLNTMGVSVFPNPVKDYFSLQLSNNQEREMLTMVLHSSTGQLVKQLPIDQATNQLVVSVTDLPKGIYFLRIQNAMGLLLKQQKIFIN